MKPSERIMEIRDQNGTSLMNTINPGFDMFVALCQYLDEEHEKNKPCEHEWKGHLECTSLIWCHKCGILSNSN